MRVLVVDDEDHIRVLLKEALEEEGWTVQLAADAFEGLEALEEANLLCRRFDLIVLDIKMPGMDGIQAMNIIKKINHDQVVILYSAYGEFKQDFSTWTSDGYVVKSADTRELMDTIRALCGDDQLAIRRIEQTERTERFEAIAAGSHGADARREVFTELWRLDPESARPLLLERGLRCEEEHLVRERVVTLLGECRPDGELVSRMIAQLCDTSWAVRVAVCNVLRTWGLSETASPLANLLSDPEPQVREAARQAIEHLNALDVAMRDEMERIDKNSRKDEPRWKIWKRRKKE